MGAYSDAVIEDSPVAFWKLNEQSGTTALDSVGSNHGTYVGSPSRVATLVAGETGAIRNTVIDQYVDTGYSGSLNVFTAEIVIQVDAYPASGTNGTLIGHRSYFASSYASFPFSLSITSSGTINASFSLGNDYSNDASVSTSDPVPIGVPLHVCLRRAADGKIDLYVNKIKTSTTLAGTLSTYGSTWKLGRSDEYGGGVGKSTYVGVYCLAAIYNYALSEERIFLHADIAVTTLSLSVDIVESLAATLFRVVALRIADMSQSYLADLAAGHHDLEISYIQNGPHIVTVMPVYGDAWEEGKTIAANDLVIPTAPGSTPYYFKALNSGTTGTTEPPWPTVPGGQVSDNGITWELVERMSQPITHGPLIPT